MRLAGRRMFPLAALRGPRCRWNTGKEFPERSHFIIGQEGWEEVADYALQWAMEHAVAPAAA